MTIKLDVGQKLEIELSDKQILELGRKYHELENAEIAKKITAENISGTENHFGIEVRLLGNEYMNTSHS